MLVKFINHILRRADSRRSDVLVLSLGEPLMLIHLLGQGKKVVLAAPVVVGFDQDLAFPRRGIHGRTVKLHNKNREHFR